MDSSEQKYPVQVVGAALVDDMSAPTRLLAAQRSAPAALDGLWEFPGGKVEPGEGLLEGLNRELSEELGIEADLVDEIEGTHPQGWPLNERLAMRVFMGTITAGDPRPLQDHRRLQWVPLDDRQTLRALPWIPADLPIVDALIHKVS
ncbi:(deoxy)nucleoside triphosphate pyrophosphohydrolase [Rothia uropygialis]|uniref:(deoxy)nucleoside triphosphate pyrophosphohydrolase n=1 Tax=Kocuria sp. 36 TaxID=1415402 RepID=UPI00237B86B0|nr:(deoxy)nucleoside triphosphate pyrophosphohydrolase [Kocuria sp. 36]